MRSVTSGLSWAKASWPDKPADAAAPSASPVLINCRLDALVRFIMSPVVLCVSTFMSDALPLLPVALSAALRSRWFRLSFPEWCFRHAGDAGIERPDQADAVVAGRRAEADAGDDHGVHVGAAEGAHCRLLRGQFDSPVKLAGRREAQQ